MSQFKYLFKALLTDNSIIEQTQDDKSKTTPGKNCFYDVLQNFDKVRAFALYNQINGVETVLDLHGCRFEINRPPFPGEGDEFVNLSTFTLHGEEVLTNIRLIWFFDRRIELNVVDTAIVSNQIVGYNCGFQGNDKNGENKQYILRLT